MTLYHSNHPAEVLCITTVAICATEPGAIPRVASFATRRTAEHYMERVKQKLEFYGIRDYYTVSLDSGPLDNQDYLSWIDEEFGEEETYYDE